MKKIFKMAEGIEFPSSFLTQIKVGIFNFYVLFHTRKFVVKDFINFPDLFLFI